MKTREYIGQDQIGVIVYPLDGNWRSPFVRHHVEVEKSKGNIIVYRGGFATVHKP